jgi:serine/threonine protein kinase
MVHGDIKGVRFFDRPNSSHVLRSIPTQANILIDEVGNARLADFGLLKIISDPANLLSSGSDSQSGTVRWMSPELIAPEDFGFEKSRHTKSSDCYALGMVVYETISGKLPFHKDTDFSVTLKVVRGERPRRGTGFAESLWNMMEFCWKPHPDDRPSIKDVLRCLETVSDSQESSGQEELFYSFSDPTVYN